VSIAVLIKDIRIHMGDFHKDYILFHNPVDDVVKYYTWTKNIVSADCGKACLFGYTLHYVAIHSVIGSPNFIPTKIRGSSAEVRKSENSICSVPQANRPAWLP